jgi:long-chain acyl-CoA synthetase
MLPDVHNFMKITLCCPVIEAYGQTENTGAAFATDAFDPQVTHVGGVLVIFFLT